MFVALYILVPTISTQNETNPGYFDNARPINILLHISSHFWQCAHLEKVCQHASCSVEHSLATWGKGGYGVILGNFKKLQSICYVFKGLNEFWFLCVKVSYRFLKCVFNVFKINSLGLLFSYSSIAPFCKVLGPCNQGFHLAQQTGQYRSYNKPCWPVLDQTENLLPEGPYNQGWNLVQQTGQYGINNRALLISTGWDRESVTRGTM